MAAPNVLTLQFLGAAQTVTGSRYLIKFNSRTVLVDCGLFQGKKELRMKNWEPFPYDPKRIDAVILTHAHIDHSGYIPRLIKEGFSGPIFCTEGTKALVETLLPDAGFLQEEEAEYLNRKKLSKHHPALPLFSRLEAEKSLKNFVIRGFGEDFEPVPGFRCCFLYAGHILGAASLVVSVGQRTIGFSGDVGRRQDPVFYPPAALPALDYLVLESTYGERLHRKTNPQTELENIVVEAVKRKGVVLIPAFAVGRTQTLLYFLSQLKMQKRIPDIPIFLNSPMANHVTETFLKFRTLHKLTDQECRQLLSGVEVIQTVEQSKGLNNRHGPMIIISASGMATGGRILHHLKAFASDPKNSIVLTGFQAAGTRGDALLNGSRELKIHGQMVSINAQVFSLDNLSAHGDYAEITSWLASCRIHPKMVFITHGESSASESMCSHIGKLGWTSRVPSHLQEFALE